MAINLSVTANVKLGVFIVLSIVLTIIGIYYIGQRQQLFNKTFQLSCIFKDVGGLQVGNNVRFSGINVGLVENIQLISDSTVKVDIQINTNVQQFIKKNAQAMVGTDGFMGNKILLILPGKFGEKAVVTGNFIATAQPLSMDDILLKVKKTSDNAAEITNDLALIMKNIRKGRGTIGKLLMDQHLAKNVDQSLVNIKNGSDGFNQNMDAAKQNWFFRGFFKKRDQEKIDNKSLKVPKREGFLKRLFKRKKKVNDTIK
jgi:phospholipid/cholesterol/gamma-HCH transport system substrate-binding protein